MAWEITGEAGRAKRRRGAAKRSGFSGLGREGTDACGARSQITDWVARRFAWSRVYSIWRGACLMERRLMNS